MTEGRAPGEGALQVYVTGVLLVLIGTVLPWMRDRGVSVWGWDVSVLWSLSGRVSLVRVPPAAAAVVLVAAVVLCMPVVGGRRLRGPVAAGAAGAVVAVAGLSLVRTVLLRGPVRPHLGLGATLVGGALAAVAAVVLGEEQEEGSVRWRSS